MNQSCAAPTTCNKGVCQCLFCDQRGAFPCDDEVPFQIGCLGLFCVGKPQIAPAGAMLGQQMVVTQTMGMPPICDMER